MLLGDRHPILPWTALGFLMDLALTLPIVMFSSGFLSTMLSELNRSGGQKQLSLASLCLAMSLCQPTGHFLHQRA